MGVAGAGPIPIAGEVPLDRRHDVNWAGPIVGIVVS